MATKVPILSTTVSFTIMHDPEILPLATLQEMSLADIEYEFTEGSSIAGELNFETATLTDPTAIEAQLVSIANDGTFFEEV